MQCTVRDYYFNVVNSNPNETVLVLGNLRIAEDRVLSYASIFKAKPYNLRLGYCPKAFKFEAEVSLKSFISQRRRWINGTFAGYLYLLFFESDIFCKWQANPARKFFVYLILLLNLVQMFSLVKMTSKSNNKHNKRARNKKKNKKEKIEM